MTFFPQDPRFYLQREYQTRHQRNAAYSWRSFARDLRLSPSMLSEFLKGRYGFSRPKALSIAETLGLSESHTQHFVDLLESEFHRSPIQRRLARLRLSRRLDPPRERTWEQLAVLEVCALENGKIQGQGWQVSLPRPFETILRELQTLGDLGLDLRPFDEVTLAVANSGALPPPGPAAEAEEWNVLLRLRATDIPLLMRELNDAILEVLNAHVREDADRVCLFHLRLDPLYRKGQFSSSV